MPAAAVVFDTTADVVNDCADTTVVELTAEVLLVVLVVACVARFVAVVVVAVEPPSSGGPSGLSPFG